MSFPELLFEIWKFFCAFKWGFFIVVIHTFSIQFWIHNFEFVILTKTCIMWPNDFPFSIPFFGKRPEIKPFRAVLNSIYFAFGRYYSCMTYSSLNLWILTIFFLLFGKGRTWLAFSSFDGLWRPWQMKYFFDKWKCRLGPNGIFYDWM